MMKKIDVDGFCFAFIAGIKRSMIIFTKI